tara:strand:- start:19934 stop:20419 length:486 start_codon:yes stop_codon:yes gene_type:complete
MFTYKEVTEHCEILTPVQIASISRSLLRKDSTPAAEDILSAGEALLLWLADLLEWTQICNQDQRTLLLQELRQVILELGEQLSNPATENIPSFHVGFADRRWVTCTGTPAFFELTTGEWVDQLPYPALETVTYECTTLFMRQLLSSQGRQEDADNSPPDAT